MQMAAAGAVSESANSTSAITGMDSKGALSDEKQGVERQGCEGEHPPHLDGGVEAGDESSVESMRQEIDKLKMVRWLCLLPSNVLLGNLSCLL